MTPERRFRGQRENRHTPILRLDREAPPVTTVTENGVLLHQSVLGCRERSQPEDTRATRPARQTRSRAVDGHDCFSEQQRGRTSL